MKLLMCLNFGDYVMEVTSSDIYIFVMCEARDFLCASSTSRTHYT